MSARVMKQHRNGKQTKKLNGRASAAASAPPIDFGVTLALLGVLRDRLDAAFADASPEMQPVLEAAIRGESNLNCNLRHFRDGVAEVYDIQDHMDMTR